MKVMIAYKVQFETLIIQWRSLWRSINIKKLKNRRSNKYRSRIYLNARFKCFFLHYLFRQQLQNLERTCEMFSYSLIPDVQESVSYLRHEENLWAYIFLVSYSYFIGTRSGEKFRLVFPSEWPRRVRKVRKAEAAGMDPRLPRQTSAYQTFIYAAR